MIYPFPIYPFTNIYVILLNSEHISSYSYVGGITVEYLYHYTSVDVLELILKNKTIRLNPLYKMDDWQEQFSAHGCAHGRHVFISSWTSESAEIPKMWQDYCKPLPENGIRIKMPVNPFSKEENNLLIPVPSEMHLTSKNREQIIRSILANYPETNREMFDNFEGLEPFTKYKDKLQKEHPNVARRLIEDSENLQRNITRATCSDVTKLLRPVDYTDNPKKIYPQLYHEYRGQMLGDFTNYGTVKNTSWAWQKEWRYIVGFYRMRAFRKKVDNTLEWYDVPFDYYDLKLDQNKLKQLEVTTSPVMSKQSRAKLQSILDQYLPGTPVQNSVLSSL